MEIQFSYVFSNGFPMVLHVQGHFPSSTVPPSCTPPEWSGLVDVSGRSDPDPRRDGGHASTLRAEETQIHHTDGGR